MEFAKWVRTTWRGSGDRSGDLSLSDQSDISIGERGDSHDFSHSFSVPRGVRKLQKKLSLGEGKASLEGTGNTKFFPHQEKQLEDSKVQQTDLGT